MFASNTGMTSIVRLLLTHDLNLHLTSTVGDTESASARANALLGRLTVGCAWRKCGVVGSAARQGRIPAGGRGGALGDLRADPPQGYANCACLCSVESATRPLTTRRARPRVLVWPCAAEEAVVPIGRAAPLAQVAAKPGSAEHTGHEGDVNLAELRRVVLPDDGAEERCTLPVAQIGALTAAAREVPRRRGDAVSSWTEQHVAAWLVSLGDEFVRFVPSFRDNNINGRRLLKLNNDKLIQLGVSSLGVRYVARAVAAIRIAAGHGSERRGATHSFHRAPQRRHPGGDSGPQRRRAEPHHLNCAAPSNHLKGTGRASFSPFLVP